MVVGVRAVQGGVKRQGDAPSLLSVTAGELANVGKIPSPPVNDRIEEIVQQAFGFGSRFNPTSIVGGMVITQQVVNQSIPLRTNGFADRLLFPFDDFLGGSLGMARKEPGKKA